ncbi:MAG TPA: ribonuclease HII [Dehalococcoidia bacterium]|nr:ribonuclease HII [Dehalococcoidia bacterium]
MAAGPRPQPSTAFEEALWGSSHRYVAGVDEVGRGPVAGPVYAGAVILDPDARPSWLPELRDSKELLPNDRQRLAEAVRAGALAWGLGWATVAEIDAWGISAANKRAMIRAIEALRVRPEYVLIDGPLTVDHPLPQRAIVDGDALCTTIAAASIVAKVARDEVMCHLGHLYPEYNFAVHKGYATRDHLERIQRYGLCNQHRRSWAAVQRRAEARLSNDEEGGSDAP